MSIAQIKTKLPAPPFTQDAALSGYLQSLHQVVSGLQAQSTQQPQTPTGLTCTPVAGGNVVSFTRSASSKFKLYISPTTDRTGATEIDLGNSNTYHHFAGSGGLLFYYWVEGLNTAGVSSGISAPVSGTTLGLATPAAVPIPTSQSYGKVHDTLSNTIRSIDYSTDQIPEGKRPTKP
jgi:hypothetical protein